jgi:hypothetical protein
MPEGVLLTDEDRALLVKVSSLLEEIVEAFSVLEDKDAMLALKRAESVVKAGRFRNYDEFLKESVLSQRYNTIEKFGNTVRSYFLCERNSSSVWTVISLIFAKSTSSLIMIELL